MLSCSLERQHQSRGKSEDAGRDVLMEAAGMVKCCVEAGQREMFFGCCLNGNIASNRTMLGDIQSSCILQHFQGVLMTMKASKALKWMAENKVMKAFECRMSKKDTVLRRTDLHGCSHYYWPALFPARKGERKD
jgi:hypothetical protein